MTAPLPRRPSSPRAEVFRLLGLAWPVVLTSLNWTILHVTDVIVVGMVGEHEVAALSASRSLTYIAIVTGLAWLSGVLVRASRADGAGDLPATGQALRDGMVLGLILGVAAMLILGLGGAALLRGIGVAPALIAPGARVVAVMALAAILPFLALDLIFFGGGHPGRDRSAQREDQLQGARTLGRQGPGAAGRRQARGRGRQGRRPPSGQPGAGDHDAGRGHRDAPRRSDSARSARLNHHGMNERAGRLSRPFKFAPDRLY